MGPLGMSAQTWENDKYRKAQQAVFPEFVSRDGVYSSVLSFLINYCT